MRLRATTEVTNVRPRASGRVVCARFHARHAVFLFQAGAALEVEETSICYHVLGRVHASFTPLPRTLKDYFSSPKPNGYRPLHTCVLVGTQPLEVQIRTHAMHMVAEHGAVREERLQHLGMHCTARIKICPSRRTLTSAHSRCFHAATPGGSLGLQGWWGVSALAADRKRVAGAGRLRARVHAACQVCSSFVSPQQVLRTVY